MIYTVTLNPAVDKTIEVANFGIGNLNKAVKSRIDAAGKGVNVSKVLKCLGCDSIALGILAGNSGTFIKDDLDKKEIMNDFVFSEGETRTNIKIVDRTTRENTEINELGPEVDQAYLKMVEEKLFAKLKSNDIVVFAGSIPVNGSEDIYQGWIAKANQIGAITILDADGNSLKAGIKATPYVIKPNFQELVRLSNQQINTDKEAINYANELVNGGIRVVVISMGAKGAIYINNKSIIATKVENINANSTIGAGDAMVAAIAYALSFGYSFDDTVKLATAVAAASVETSGTQPAHSNAVKKMLERVSLEYLPKLDKYP